jgi:hypothetical protein
MVAQMKNPNPIHDLEWIIDITKSSKTMDQLKSSLNCFLLWDKLYSNQEHTSKSKMKITEKKSLFWAIFKTKECEFSSSLVVKK